MRIRAKYCKYLTKIEILKKFQVHIKKIYYFISSASDNQNP